VSKTKHNKLYVANDNVPFSSVPKGDAVGFNAMLRERQKKRREQELHGLKAPDEQDNHHGFWLACIIWLGFGAAIAWSFYTSQSIGIRIFSAIGLIWSGLWARFLAIDHNRPRLSELALLSSLMGFIGLLITATLQMGYPLSLAGGMFLFMAASLTVSFLNRSNIALICAIGACALPALWALIIFQAIRLKSDIAVKTGVIVGYFWLISSAALAYFDGTLGALYFAVGAVIIGNMHYRVSKAAEDEGYSHTRWHVSFGWIVANIGLLCLAKYGVDPTDPLWQNSRSLAPLARLIWMSVIVAAIAAYFGAGLIRKRHSRMSISGTFLTTLILLGLSFGVWFLPQTETWFSSLTSLPAYPAWGYFIFGIVTGHIVFFVFNSFRRGHFEQISAGLLMLAALAILSSGFDIIHQDNWVFWLLGTITACVISLIAVEPQLAALESPELHPSLSNS